MNTDNAKILMQMLKDSFPKSKLSDSEYKIRFKKMLALDENKTQKAIERLYDTMTFMPSHAEILNEIAELNREEKREHSKKQSDKPKEIQCWVCLDKGLVPYEENGYPFMLYCDCCSARSEHYGLQRVSARFDPDVIARNNQQISRDRQEYMKSNPGWKKQMMERVNL